MTMSKISISAPSISQPTSKQKGLASFVSGSRKREWIIQRFTGKSSIRPELPGVAFWVLEYEDLPTPEGVMTRARMLRVLDRVCRKNPDSEFRGHCIAERKVEVVNG